MANTIDEFPYYDDLVKKGTLKISSSWALQLGSFTQTLNGYLSPYGMFLPQLTTVQIATIQAPVEGQMIYNTSILAPQIWQAGAWKTFTTT